MFENPTDQEVEAAFRSAHAERAQAFATALGWLLLPFRWLRRPQGEVRPVFLNTQVRPAGL